MGPGTIAIRSLENVFFVFTDKNLFLIPEREYKHFQKTGDFFIYTKKKHIPEVTGRDTGKVICIICREETEPEDFVSPLCQQMHFVLCEVCFEYLKGRADKREVVCPYCKENQSDKVYQEGILGVLFSLAPEVKSIAIKPDMEVETAMRLTRETKSVLDNSCVSDTLFFGLMSRTTVEIRDRISLFRNKTSRMCCLWEPDQGDDKRVNICIGEYTKEEMEQIHENIRTMPRSCIKISTQKIYAADNGIHVFLNLCAAFDEQTLDISLDSSKREYMEEILRERNKKICLGEVKRLVLARHAIEILPMLEIHEESEMEELRLRADSLKYIKRILRIEKGGIWVGKVKNLHLTGYAVRIFLRLYFHEENEMEELCFSADNYNHIAGIPQADNNSLLVGKVKSLRLEGHALKIFPKLRFHKENKTKEFSFSTYDYGPIYGVLETKKRKDWVRRAEKLNLGGYAIEILPRLGLYEESEMEEIVFGADYSCNISGIFGMGRNSIWMGKVKNLRLEGYAVDLLPKLDFHRNNVMEVLGMYADDPGYIIGILGTKNKSILVGTVRTLRLQEYAVEILPKLGFCRENVMEELILDVYDADGITGILGTKNKSIWMGTVRTLRLQEYAVEILPKLGFCRENVMEELILDVYDADNITKILKTKNNNIWVGMVKSLRLEGYAVGILPKLGLHEENEMEVFCLSVEHSEHIAGILVMENECIWVGKVKKMRLIGYAVDILPKLDLHEENEMEVLDLYADNLGHISGVLKNDNIWVGMVESLLLGGYAVDILSKLGLHEENEMDMLNLYAGYSDHITAVLGTETQSIYIGKVKNLILDGYAVEVLPKLKIHEENDMEKFILYGYSVETISRILKMKKESIWIGRVKSLFLHNYAIEILPKLRLHEDNEMEELSLNTDKDEHITGILGMENHSIWLWGVKKLRLEGHAKLIENKLSFMSISSDSQDENEDDI
ncbi:MAG: uncharacterized protein A8A55_2637 [Amphiamblys sp. WSBS2006]|nr:MAG: uncharacterized protein A8A55_2637 [Amphiamblys sp. WSBS2006]